MNREAWLEGLADSMRPEFNDYGRPLPERIRYGIGFPSKRALSKKTRRVGECWFAEQSLDGTVETFISPMIDLDADVYETLVHELSHAALGPAHGHGRLFKRLNAEMFERGETVLETFIATNGPYPHAALSAEALAKRPKQSTRLLKVSCGTCGYIARVTRQWIDRAGAPICPTDKVTMDID